ncbi:hypothetical protein PRIEUP_LOCUS299, partial [Pristimantis euphronides]
MRLLQIVFFFSYYLLGSANQTSTDEADCDSQNVFRAADEVLRSFNDAKEDGNQFVLYRIMEARKKEETGRVHIFIKLKIQESACQVKNGMNWQRCAFKVNEADYGECSAHVLVNKESNSEIINQNCSITKGKQPQEPKQPVVEPIVTVVHHPCLGCFHMIDTKSEMLLPILHSAIEQMNRVGNHQFHFDLENITKAEQQVVHGWNYNLEYKIRQTNCSKRLFPKLTPAECSLDENGQWGHCFTKVFVTPNEEIKDINLKCESSTGFCLSCPDQVENNDPELLSFLKKFIEEYNLQSNHTNFYKVEKVGAARKILIQNNQQYKVNFEIQETNCSKSDHSVLGEECDVEPFSKKLFCDANINVQNETVNILQDHSCHASPQMALRIIIKGLSPLRKMPTLVRSRSPEKSKQKENGPDHKAEKLGKKTKKDKKDKGKKKHNGKHGHSSEEPTEDTNKQQVLPSPTLQAVSQVPEIDTSVTTSQQTNPADEDKVHVQPLTQLPTQFIPNLSDSSLKEETYPNIHETFTLDPPVLLPEDIPKCPGKIWQPLLLFPQIPTDKPFVIDGLTFHDNDLLLSELE